jgi:hypothetical protein
MLHLRTAPVRGICVLLGEVPELVAWPATVVGAPSREGAMEPGGPSRGGAGGGPGRGWSAAVVRVLRQRFGGCSGGSSLVWRGISIMRFWAGGASG